MKDRRAIWWVGGNDTTHHTTPQHNTTGQEKPEEHFKSLFWVVPLTHSVYIISLFVILTHSWAQGKFVLLSLLSSLKNSTSTVFQVTSGCAYHLAPSGSPVRANTNISCKITFFMCNCSSSACSRPWPCTIALFSFLRQKPAFHKSVKIGGKILP